MQVDEETKTTKGFAFIEFLTPEVCIPTHLTVVTQEIFMQTS